MNTNQFFKNVKINISLAYPIVLGQVSHVITGMADTVMVGHIGSDYLAAASFAHTIYMIIFLFGIGLGMGLTPLVGIANGENNQHKSAIYFKNGLLIFTISGFIIAGINLIILPFFGLMGQEENVAELAKPYFITLALSSIPYMVFITYKQFTEGLSNTKPAMIISLACNLLNIILNYFLIYGIWIFPELKLLGAGIATLIARITMAISFMVYFNFSENYKIYLKFLKSSKYSLVQIKMILKLGIPIGLQFLLEITVFSVGAIMVGWSGKYSLAAHQIALTLASFTFLAASGLASAGTIRLSNLLGERKFVELKGVANSIFIMVAISMSITAVIFYIFRFSIPLLFINEMEVVEITGKLLIIAAFFQIFDGLQASAQGALRGIKDVKIPTFISFISYWIVGITSCYLLSETFELGAFGVWYGYLIALIVTSVLLLTRFYYILNKTHKLTI